MAFGTASLRCGFTLSAVEGPRASQHSLGETWKPPEREPRGILGSLSALEEKGLQCVERLLNWGKRALALACTAGGHADEGSGCLCRGLCFREGGSALLETLIRAGRAQRPR